MARFSAHTLILLLLVSCSSGGGGGGCSVPKAGGPGSGWTFLVYMAGDNNLSAAALRDLDEMSEVGSNGDVRIVVQRDLADDGSDLTNDGAERLIVGTSCFKTLEDLGEINSASPDALKDFIEWATAQYPADRTALILWSHGDGHQKPQAGAIHESPLRTPWGILQDDTDGVDCCLSILSVRQAIEDAGTAFDLLGFDASMMGQIETAYEFRNTADVLVFSQESGQENGWDYAPILQELTDNPAIGARSLAETIVAAYERFYEDVFYPANPQEEKIFTISAVDLGAPLDDVVSALDDLSQDLFNSLNQSATVEAVTSARGATQNLNAIGFCNLYMDLFDWIEIMGSQAGLSQEVQFSLAALEALKDDLIFSEYHGSARPDAQGLSIVFHADPDNGCSNFSPDYLDGTSGHAFVEDTSWDEFLSQYFEAAGLL